MLNFAGNDYLGLSQHPQLKLLAAQDVAGATASPLICGHHSLAQQLEQDYQLLNAFRDAIRQKHLELWLQPKVDPQGKIQSFEALSRWFIDGQAIAPDSFVLMAERHGLMTMFSRLVLQQSVGILQSWQQQGQQNQGGDNALFEHGFS